MPDPREKRLRNLDFKARLPQAFRIGAVGVLALAVLAVGLGWFRARNNPEFRMKGFPTRLSKDVIAVVDGYERREADGEFLKYVVRADRATTFADNHQELENVFLEVYAEDGISSDRITGAKAVYVPEENKNFTGYFAGSVNIQTRDGLIVKTEQITYRKADETATADEQVLFERAGVRGSSFGAVVNVPAKQLELLRDVDITASETAGDQTNESNIKAGRAVYDQISEKIELNDNVAIRAVSGQSLADLAAGRAVVHLAATSEKGRDLVRSEMFENVRIKVRQNNSKPTNLDSNYAVYDKPADRFE
ncbi:MAG: LPS export ABC transporter periplasmic protein LptC, partial [Acidobacteria bacterium]|nr:LPS export ABC transporter periplasmic protein LptC [Acidobacteriota bacterium]MCA1608420.1 LPS export ABC transporter periplasmic protein LptC [Acidobacteriota bacterium]